MSENATTLSPGIRRWDVDEFKIEQDIPVPQRSARAKYPWHKMRVGDSIAVPVVNRQFESAKASAYGYFRKHGWELTTRVLGEYGRIWRTK